MQTLLIAIILVSGILFSGAVMFTSPKGGLGFGISGAAGWNEYTSQKSLEHTFKNTAYIAWAVFIVTCIIYPFIIN